MMSFKILGTCAGTGVPSFFCDCIGCMEARQNPQYARTRTGAFLETEKGRVLIDAPPDIRSQLIKESIYSVDTIFLTHWHADHYSGLSEFEYYVRLQTQKPLVLYLPASAVEKFEKTFPELNDIFQIVIWEYHHEYKFGNISLTPLRANHSIDTAGFLIKSKNSRLAYFPDTSGLPKETAQVLHGINYFVCDATFYGENWYPHSHMSVEQAIKVGREIKAENIILTHLSIHYSQPVTTAKLEMELARDTDVTVAYDGMCIELK